MSDAATQATEDYLARLDREAREQGMGSGDRAELRARTAEWIADRRADAVLDGIDPMSAVLDTINGLGTPSALIDEARASGLGQHARAQTRLTIAERIAVIGLATGWMTAGLAWIAAVIAMMRCTRWTLKEKFAAAIATLLFPGAAVQVGTATVDPTPATLLGFVALIALTVSAPLLLIWRLRQRSGLPV